MSALLTRLRHRLHRLRHYEFWPYWAFYFPVFLLWPWLSLRARSLVFFTNTNPFIPLGGSIEESKSAILRQLPAAHVARWTLVAAQAEIPVIAHWPVVAKPDVGERGAFVEIIEDREGLRSYQRKLGRSFIVQEFVSDPFEAGVLVIRDAATGNVRVTSVVTKGFLAVTGDGQSRVQDLVLRDPRAEAQWERLRTQQGLGERVLPRGETLLLEPIGNHCRGTTFIDGSSLITPEVVAQAQRIVDEIPGFYLGRFDLKAPSADEFTRGRGWKILELNGAFSEPGHIYDPQWRLVAAWRELIYHWVAVSTLSRDLRSRGNGPAKLSDFLRAWLAYRRRTA